MKQKDIRPLKEILWLNNNKKCPVLDIEIPLEKMTLDHAHKRKIDEYGVGKGTIRESLDFRSNAVLGKLENAIKRTGLNKLENFSLPTFLRNAADYFERGDYIDKNGNRYIHPSEVHKEPNLSKKNYNKCKKLYEQDTIKKTKKKFPAYPKLKRCTKELETLFKTYGISKYP